MANGEIITGVLFGKEVQTPPRPDRALMSKEGEPTFEAQRKFFLSNDEIKRITENSITQSPKNVMIVGLLNNLILGKTKAFFTETECERILKEHNLGNIFQNAGNLAGYLDLMIEQRDISYAIDLLNLR